MPEDVRPDPSKVRVEAPAGENGIMPDNMSSHLLDPKFRALTPEELSRRITDGTAPRIIDVRESFEWDIAHIEGAELMALSEIREWWQALDPEEEIVFYCHTGRRSASVCAALAAEGFGNLINLEGGIEAWSLRVDPQVPRY